MENYNFGNSILKSSLDYYDNEQPRIQKIINECTQKAHKLIIDNKKDVEKIAQLLLQKNTVLGEEIYNLLNLQAPKLQDELTFAAQVKPAV